MNPIRTNKFFYFFIFITLFLISVVSAAQPTVVITTTSGTIDILTPINKYHQLNTKYILKFHVFNSTGHVLTNVTTKCNLHLYNTTQEYIYENVLPYTGDDFEVEIGADNFSKTGTYAYNMWCNSTQGQGGSLQGSIIVTKDGVDYSLLSIPSNISEWSYLGMHFFFLFIVVICGIASYNLDDYVTGTLCSMGLFIWGVYMLNSGFNGIQNDITLYLGWLFFGLGIYFMIPVFQWAVDELNLTEG